MAGWNGSDRKGAAPAQPKVTAKKPSPVRGTVAGAVVVVLALVAYFVFFSGTDKPQAEKSDKERGRIREVAPAAAPKAKTNEVVKVEKIKKPSIPTYIDSNGVKRYRGGLRVNEGKSEVTIDIAKFHQPDIFKNYAESQIAFLITTEPGEPIFGEYDYGHPRFRKELENALINKIEESEDDTEEDRKLKQAVTDVKAELRQALKRGEDISQILADTRHELQRLGQFQRDMEDQVREMSKNAEVSNEDLEDYVAAANKMLAEKGIAPLKLNCVSKRAMKYRRERMK